MIRRPVLLLLLMASPLAAQAPEAPQVRFLGQVRLRAEVERPGPAPATEFFTLLRGRVGLEAALSERGGLLLEVQDARTLGEESSTTDGAADRLDMHQAWLQYRFGLGGLGGLALAARAGRQEVAFGAERLVGAADWTNTGRAFDGVRLALTPPDARWRANLLAATVAERGRRLGRGDGDAPDHVFGGLYVEARPLEAFALFDRNGAHRGWMEIDRATLGARVVALDLGGATATAEGAVQLGSQRFVVPSPTTRQDVRAWMAGVRLGLDTGVPEAPAVGLGLDLLSGDDAPTDGTYRAFHTLYGTNHRYYGLMDLFLDPAARTLDRGLVDAVASLRVMPDPALPLDLDAHVFWLHRELGGAPGRRLGWELDLTVPVSLGAGQNLQLGYGLFRSGPAAPATGLGSAGEWWHWGYAQVAFGFGGRGGGLP